MNAVSMLRSLAPIALVLGAAGCGPSGEVQAAAPEPAAAAPGRGAPPLHLVAVRDELAAGYQRMRESALAEPLRRSIETLLLRPDELFAFDGWVARRHSLAHDLVWNFPGPEGAAPRAEAIQDPRHPIHAIRSYARQLAARGVELLVVPVPTRTEVYPDRLPGVPPVPADFAGHGPGTTFLLATLAAEGIEVVDLLPTLAAARHDPDDAARDRLYLDFDHHWTPRAARLAVARIAARLEQLDGYEAGPAREGVDFVVRAEAGEHQPYGNPQPPPEAVTFHRVLTPGGAAVDAKDRQSPLLLLGDSFCGQYQDEASDLTRLLHAATGHEVDAITMSAGATQVWTALARRGDGLAGKRWVVWVFTSRAFDTQKFPRVELAGG